MKCTDFFDSLVYSIGRKIFQLIRNCWGKSKATPRALIDEVFSYLLWVKSKEWNIKKVFRIILLEIYLGIAFDLLNSLCLPLIILLLHPLLGTERCINVTVINKFSLVLIGVLAPRVCPHLTQSIDMSGNFTVDMSVTFKHLHQPLRSHMQSLITLWQLLKIPPLSDQKRVVCCEFCFGWNPDIFTI